jgi:hypothetical protein
MNVLSDLDIYEILNHHNIKINGIYQKDKLTDLQDGFYVINLQPSTEGNGSHWCGLYYNFDKSYWFDSFGFVPPEEIELLLQDYDYNDNDVQNINSSSCGFYVIAFIKFLYNKKDKYIAYKTFLNLFKTNTFQNERILKSLLEK